MMAGKEWSRKVRTVRVCPQSGSKERPFRVFSQFKSLEGASLTLQKVCPLSHALTSHVDNEE